MGILDKIKSLFSAPKATSKKNQFLLSHNATPTNTDTQFLERDLTKHNPKFSRTDKEEELSFQFSYRNSDKLAKLDAEIYAAKNNIGKAGIRWQKKASVEEIQERIKQCDNAITVYEKYKKICYRSKGGQIYFQDMWEYCHNTHNPCFDYIDDVVKLKAELENLLQNKATTS